MEIVGNRPEPGECIFNSSACPKKNIYRYSECIDADKVYEFFHRFQEPEYTEVIGWLTYSSPANGFGKVEAHVLCEKQWK